MTPEPQKPAVIVISSHVARGSVGGRGALFVLERLGHPVWFVPTVMLAWHPGHGRSTRIETPVAGFQALLDDLAESPALAEVGAIITGYFANAEQAAAAARFIEKVRANRSDLLVVVDPIMGDKGHLYVASETAAAIRDWLVPQATLTTPNVFELGWLTGEPVEGSAAIASAARKLTLPNVVITSVPALMRGSIGTMLVCGEAAFMGEHREVEAAPNGTGDMLTAVMTARLLAGKSPEQALKSACASVFEMVARSARAGANELRLSAEQDVILHPMADVQIRRMAASPRKPLRPGALPSA